MVKQIISFLTGAPIEKVAEYFLERQEMKHKLRIAKIQGKIDKEMAQAAHYADWEMAQIANSGWKDEFVLLTISYPLYASFIPWTQKGVAQGFDILGTTPVWYMGIVMTVYLAIYGVRWRAASTLKI